MDLREVPRDGSHETAQRHPWEVSRFGFFREVLARLANLGVASDILDVGSGDAWFAGELGDRIAPSARITCWDIAYADHALRAMAVASSRVQLAHEQPDQEFDLVLMLDVLEHVADDIAFLQGVVSRNLRRGGFVLVSVPAWPMLMTSHDDFLGHHRRYTPRALARLVATAELSVVRRGGLFHSLLLPRLITAAREQWQQRRTGQHARGSATPSDDARPAHEPLHWSHGPLLTRVITSALRVDNRVSYLASGIPLELPGLTAWALCRK